jgi:20S proteasome subunit alpha 2
MNLEWKAVAVGENYKNAKEFLEKRYNPDLLLEDVIHTALLTLKEGFEGEMTSKNIEIAYVDKKRKFKVLTPSEI